MIKLGVQHKDQVKVDSLANTINSAKLELESINKETILKQKELNDVLSRLDFAILDLDNQFKDFDSKVELKNNELTKLNSEVFNLTAIKSELIDKLNELEETIELEKSSISSNIKEFEQSESKKLKVITSDVAKLEAKKLELEDYITVLSIDSQSNMIALDDLKKELSGLEEELVIKRKEDNILSSNLDSYSDKESSLLSSVSNLTADVNNLNEIINSINVEITKANEVKDVLTKEVEALNIEKDEFNREKLAFQSQKEMILLREQFIMDKYLTAGVPYK